jgi:DNA-binding GntR family transcriptional regulator
MKPARLASDVRHLTKNAFVYETLREAIIRGELRAGERLIIDELARRYEVSIIPVREALRLLQSEGLVVSVAHVGATVAPMSRESVLEVFTLLEGLELVSSRAAAERATAAQLDDIERLVREMDDAIATDAPERWGDLNTEFHLAISRAAGMPILHQMMQRALDLWDRVRRHYFRGVLSRRARKAQIEHRSILQHLRRRELVALEESIRRHNQNALAAYTAYLDAAHDARGAARSGARDERTRPRARKVS